MKMIRSLDKGNRNLTMVLCVNQITLSLVSTRGFAVSLSQGILSDIQDLVNVHTTLEMDPEAEDPENNGHIVTWLGSDSSQELYMSDSCNEDIVSDADPCSDTRLTHTPNTDAELSESPPSQELESLCRQKSLPEISGSQENVLNQEINSQKVCKSKRCTTESPQINTSHSYAGQVSRTQSASPASSSSSFGCGDMTLALILTPEPQGDTRSQSSGNRKVESSEEGGSSEAPPAPVFFGISAEGAEQAERCNSESDTDLCRPDRRRAKHTRLSHVESQSEKHVKETKSKCKRIARLLTDAPNPQNKGALLFKRRRQRVEKYTLVSYGTGVNELDNEGQIEEETEEASSIGFNFEATSDSEPEENVFYWREEHFDLNWENLREMEALPETKGKGVAMFAQRRQRMDELAVEQEELRRKSLLVEAITEPEQTQIQNIYDIEKSYAQSSHQANQKHMDIGLNQNLQYQENTQQMNHLSPIPRPLVPNRTAKPFLGFQDSTPAPMSPDVIAPVAKRHDLKFKVPVPINTNPKVWSPSGDIIASRDERISVPAIKTGILPESKRRGSNKQSSMSDQASDHYLQSKVERRSYIESEEDFFSLGAEACNFMQPRSVKLKNPPPVAPKPSINPNCPPWLRRSPSHDLINPPRSPVSPSMLVPMGSHTQHYSEQQDCSQAQQMANPWAPGKTLAQLQILTNTWTPVNTSQSPVSIKARSPTHSSSHTPSFSGKKSSSVANSVLSCPTQVTNSLKAASAYPRGRASDRSGNSASDGPTLMGKGAELFAKRQSRMQKFVVDGEKVQAKKTRSPSPTPSLPNSWRYSSNIRAPPPLSYNPLLAPFYPPSAAKQPVSTSPKIQAKTKGKPKAPPKHLNTLDVMKHQPYQLDSSLFRYEAVTEVKSPSPKTSPAPISKFKPTSKRSSAPSHSSYNTFDHTNQSKSKATAKSTGAGLGRSYSLSLPRRFNSVPSQKCQSPVGTPEFQPMSVSAQRQTSWQEKTFKPPSPWVAASKSPIGSVDEAFAFQSFPSSVAANVKAAGQRRSLPEPPAEWKCRVSLDAPDVSKGLYHPVPAFRALSLSRTLSAEKPVFYGPPFRPAQPLRSGGRAFIGYMGQRPTNYSPLLSTAQRS
ncbi:synaptopodin-2 [Lampris incognitus]|uniref:synaptopodin-2 n=1 Tax=Lampris incognitus TaxID=2546036 RepID=UPI0024B4A6C9|nr:synaptopodin-2 [Lampris incognitus]